MAPFFIHSSSIICLWVYFKDVSIFFISMGSDHVTTLTIMFRLYFSTAKLDWKFRSLRCLSMWIQDSFNVTTRCWLSRCSLSWHAKRLTHWISIGSLPMFLRLCSVWKLFWYFIRAINFNSGVLCFFRGRTFGNFSGSGIYYLIGRGVFAWVDMETPETTQVNSNVN